jgi:hypothetical protein
MSLKIELFWIEAGSGRRQESGLFGSNYEPTDDMKLREFLYRQSD